MFSLLLIRVEKSGSENSLKKPLWLCLMYDTFIRLCVFVGFIVITNQLKAWQWTVHKWSRSVFTARYELRFSVQIAVYSGLSVL
jgi:hypothetical protein